MTLLVNGPCNQLFTGAVFSSDENCSVGAGYEINEFIDFLHLVALTDDFSMGGPLSHFLTEQVYFCLMANQMMNVSSYLAK